MVLKLASAFQVSSWPSCNWRWIWRPPFSHLGIPPARFHGCQVAILEMFSFYKFTELSLTWEVIVNLNWAESGSLGQLVALQVSVIVDSALGLICLKINWSSTAIFTQDVQFHNYRASSSFYSIFSSPLFWLHPLASQFTLFSHVTISPVCILK